MKALLRRLTALPPLRSFAAMLRDCRNYRGRCSRTDCLMSCGVLAAVLLLVFLISLILPAGCVLLLLCIAAALLPASALFARRLHDTGRSAWWTLFGLLPLIGWGLLITFLLRPGDSGENLYGAAPGTAGKS